jgi:hypothetical protein
MIEAGSKSLKEYPELDNGRVERRYASDRRTLSSTTHHYHLVGGRRKNCCRRGKQYDYFVDWHNPFHFAVVTGIMLLSVIDALMTTAILSVGGEEVNLLMDWVIQNDIKQFVQVKFALTGLGLILLTRYIHFRIFSFFKVFHFMLAAFIGYSVLIVYEIFCFI